MDIPKSQQAKGNQKRSTAERERDVQIEIDLWTRNYSYQAIADHINQNRDGASRSYAIHRNQIGNDIREWRKRWAEARVDDVNSLMVQLIAGFQTNIRLAHDAFLKSEQPKIETSTEFEPHHDGAGNVDRVVKRTVKRVHRDPDVACIAEIRQNISAIARVTGLEMPREWRIGVTADDGITFMDMLKIADATDQSELEAHADEI